jgi:hypothetical protein
MRDASDLCPDTIKAQDMDPELKQPPLLGRSTKGLPAHTLLNMAVRWGFSLAAAAHWT